MRIDGLSGAAVVGGLGALGGLGAVPRREDTRPRAAAPSPGTLAAVAPGPTVRVLIVEDYEDWADAVSHAVRRSAPGAAVTVVGTYSEAARAMAGERWDLVVADLILRGAGTGLDVVRSALARGIPTVLTTSHVRRGLDVPAGARYVHKDALIGELPGLLTAGPRPV